MSVRTAYAQPPWAGTELPASDVGELPPPIPGETASFRYSSQRGAYPWAGTSWAGGYPLTPYPGGGILAHPNPDLGVVRVTAWWPDARDVVLLRLHPDDSAHPLRGGRRMVGAATRHNHCSNPSVAVGLNGYIPGAGSPTLARVATTAGHALRATIASAGSCGVAVPHTLSVDSVTIGFTLHLTARPTAVTITVGWTDSAAGALTASTITLSDNEINDSVSQFARHVVLATPAVGAATVGTISITATDLTAGDALLLTQITLESGMTDGSPFDGDDLTGIWLGTPGLSESALAPLIELDDGECPLDVPVRYVAINPAFTGGQVTSDPTLLASAGHTWLTHPSAPANPLRVDLSVPPVLEHDVDQGIFVPVGGRVPIVVSGRRQVPRGTLGVYALSFAQRDLLRAMFADAAPVLLRAPAEFGYGTGAWLALGKVTEDREDRKPWQQAVLLSAPFAQVGEPPDQVAPVELVNALLASQPPVAPVPVPQLATEQEPLIPIAPAHWFAEPPQVVDHVLFGPELAVLALQDFATRTDVIFRAVNPRTGDTVWEHTVTFPEHIGLNGGEMFPTLTDTTPETVGYAFYPGFSPYYPGAGIYTGSVNASGASATFFTAWPGGAPDFTQPGFYGWWDGNSEVDIKYWTEYDAPGYTCWRIPLSSTAATSPTAVTEVHVNQDDDTDAQVAYYQTQTLTPLGVVGLFADPTLDHILITDDTGTVLHTGPSFGAGQLYDSAYWILQQVDRTQDLVAQFAARVNGVPTLLAQYFTLAPTLTAGPVVVLSKASPNSGDPAAVRVAGHVTDQPRAFNRRCRIMGQPGFRPPEQPTGTIGVVVQNMEPATAGALSWRFITPGDGLAYSGHPGQMFPSTTDDGYTLLAGTGYDSATDTTHSIYQLFLT